MKIKIPSKKVKGLVFLIESPECCYLNIKDVGYPPYCKYPEFCPSKFLYGDRKYCKEKLK